MLVFSRGGRGVAVHHQWPGWPNRNAQCLGGWFPNDQETALALAPPDGCPLYRTVTGIYVRAAIQTLWMCHRGIPLVSLYELRAYYPVLVHVQGSFHSQPFVMSCQNQRVKVSDSVPGKRVPPPQCLFLKSTPYPLGGAYGYPEIFMGYQEITNLSQAVRSSGGIPRAIPPKFIPPRAFYTSPQTRNWRGIPFLHRTIRPP